MDHRERMTRTLRGLPTDRIPFVPRLDLWYKANRAAGTLPVKYKNATLNEMTDDLDLGCHSVIPDFRDFEDGAEGPADIGLGIYRFRALPYTVKFRNIGRKTVTRPDGLTETEYVTPYGTLKTRVVFDEGMKAGGATLSVTVGHAVRGPGDYEAAAYIFENAEVTPNYGFFSYHRNEVVGNRGLAAAYCSNYCSPMYYILKELMPVEAFFYELHDNPGDMAAFVSRLSGFCEKVFEVAAGSPADLILSGANYDSAITSPPFFSKHIAPELKRQADVLHGAGKFLATHTDGENAGLLGYYADCGADVADSICPAPMTRLALREVREAFGQRVTVWGGIPSVCVLRNSMGDYEFEKYLDMTLESVGKGDHMIFSIADTTPPGAEFDRILTIAKKTAEFGPVSL